MHTHTGFGHAEPIVQFHRFHGPEPLTGRASQTSPAPRPKRLGTMMVRFLVVAAMMVSTAAIGTFAMAAPAAAHGVDTNGCTGVPDSGYGFDFHDACDHHDRCYATKPYGTSSAGRSACDQVFLNDMLSYCSRYSVWSGPGIACRTVARTYYVGVRVLGYPFWALSAPAPIA